MEKLTAIVLSSRDIGEFDRIYLLYTKEKGLLRTIGRGVRKQTAKLAGHLEPGTLSEVYVARSRGMGQITSAITLEGFPNLKNNFENLCEVLKIFRFFEKKFSEDDQDEKIFSLLVSVLEYFGRSENFKKIVTEAFWWKLFDLLGHRPETMKCANCGTGLSEKEQKYFSIPRGGVVCKKCSTNKSEDVEVTPNQIKLLRIFLANSLEKIAKVKIDDRELERLGKIRGEFQEYNF